jgi:hypothetical protein
MRGSTSEINVENVAALPSSLQAAFLRYSSSVLMLAGYKLVFSSIRVPRYVTKERVPRGPFALYERFFLAGFGLD